MSGAVKSSDAEQLWTESRSIREWSADRIAQLTGIITALEERINAVEERNKGLVEENRDLEETLDKLRQELAQCRTAMDRLRDQLRNSEQPKGDL